MQMQTYILRMQTYWSDFVSVHVHVTPEEHSWLTSLISGGSHKTTRKKLHNSHILHIQLVICVSSNFCLYHYQICLSFSLF